MAVDAVRMIALDMGLEMQTQGGMQDVFVAQDMEMAMEMAVEIEMDLEMDR
jgi:hypothetical protein